jgi:hypothetical protein
VTGTESGFCPRCGFVPPTALPVTEEHAPPDRRLDVVLLALMIALALSWFALR